MAKISDLSSRWLNSFALPATWRLGTRAVSAIVFSLVVLCLCMCAWMTIVCIPQKFVLMIDQVSLGQMPSVTIGQNSDINVDGVPYNYLTVTNTGGQCQWTVNPEYKDTLQYFKVNNSNPNAFEVKNDAGQTIEVSIPSVNSNGKKQTRHITLHGNDIWNCWKDFSKQKDVMLRNFIVYNDLRGKDTKDESVSVPDPETEYPSLRSFLENNNGKILLVILDPHTTIDGKGYQRSGTVDESNCKVQFFNVGSYCYKDDSNAKGYFQIAGVNYVMKPTVRTTKWGAGHIMLRWKDGVATLCMPKAVGYVGSIDSLRHAATKTSNVVTFRQSDLSFPSNSDIFLPYFSHTVSQDICNLEFSEDGSSISLRDNDNTTVEVPTSPSSFFVPSLTKVKLHSGSTVLDCRAGYINTSFMLHYILLPFIVVLLLTFIILGPFSPLKVKRGTIGSDVYNSRQLRDLPLYVTILLWIGFAYTVCKSMIALKLSYTCPYFEKLTGITPFNTSMLLLLFFTVMLIINYGITNYGKKSRRRHSRGIHRGYATWVVLTAIFIGLCFTLFRIADSQISYGIIRSYFPREIGYFPHNWLSSTAFGTQDNHRTICYALITTEGAMLVILLFLYLFGSSLYSWAFDLWKNLRQKLAATSWAKATNSYIDHLIAGRNKEEITVQRRKKKYDMNEYIKDVKSHLPASGVLLVLAVLVHFFADSTLVVAALLGLMLVVLLLDFVHDAFLAAIRTLFPGHLVLILLLAIAGSALGNFGTAFITLGVILGLTRALTSVRFAVTNAEGAEALPRHKVFTEMLIISVAYILGAMMADNGYMTNYLGFLMAVLCFYFVILRPGTMLIRLNEEQKKERRWVRYTIVAVVILAFMLPTVCSKFVNTESVDYSRMTRRIMLFSNFTDLQKSGFRYSESDSEFMVVMSHYMQLNDGEDPLSNDSHFLHSSVSTGQSPVVLNDLSVPIAFFGSYGLFMTTMVYFILMFCLLIMVIHYSFSYNGRSSLLTKAMQWRLLAVFMWIGTSLYIYLSYLGRLPFTGRLNPGFGVDAVGEALETAFLLAFMAAITLKKDKRLAANPQAED